jgi:hypothetical protein
MLKHCAANRKRRVLALPNVSSYMIYTTLKFLALQGAPYIIYISSLRVKDGTLVLSYEVMCLNSYDELIYFDFGAGCGQLLASRFDCFNFIERNSRCCALKRIWDQHPFRTPCFLLLPRTEHNLNDPAVSL